MEFAHVCLAVADLEMSIAFYTEELGFERFDTPGEDQFVAADNEMTIQLREVASVPTESRLDHLACVVEDVDAAVERIDHYGLVQEPTDQPAAGARTAFIEDPDGNQVELIEF
jgi:lactoylglutathione lyase